MAVEAGPIRFQEAIDFFRSKVNLPTAKWDDLLRQAQVRGFSVAGIMRDDWLSEIRAAIDKAQVSGTGLRAFQDTFDAFVKRTGWQYYSRGETEEERSAWRAKLIYKTNMRVSYMAGRYRQLTDPDVLKYRPYWRYKHSGNEHPRRLHLSWNGLVLLATDPAWRVMFPPNGFGCGCDVEALSKRQLRALGKTGPDQAPNLSPWQETDPRTGQEETRYIGIDRGWEYNPGMEWLKGVAPEELTTPLAPAYGPRQPLNLPPMPAPEAVPASRLLPADLSNSDYAKAFLGEFGLQTGDVGYWRDRSGGIVTISEDLFDVRIPTVGTVVGAKANKRGRGEFALLIADTIKDPDEIWIDWASVQSGIVLKRAYLKRVTMPDGRTLFVRFEWTKRGWIAVTGFSPSSDDYNDAFRAGALVYRK